MTTWRTVHRAPEYEVSDAGQVRRAGRVLKGWSGSRGYRLVALCSDGAQRNIQVHRLVLEAFVGPCPPGMEGCHNDGNPSNNALSNLRWDTPSANRYDTVRHGNHPAASRTACVHGHPFDEENTRTRKDGSRECRACDRISHARRYRPAARRSAA
jgi:hypothetical protein